MMYRAYSRRKFIRKYIFTSTILLGGGWVFGGCESKETAQKDKVNVQEDKENATPSDPCNDLSGVSKNEIEKREKLGYVKESPIPDQQCGNCNLYIPSGDAKDCGKCMLFKGPVYAAGYCTYWAPQV